MGLGAIVRSVLEDVRTGAFSLIANSVAGSALVPRVLRIILLRGAGLHVGRAQIRPEVTFTTRRVRLADGVFINRGTFFDSQAWVTLEEKVHVGYGVMFCTSTHDLGVHSCRAGKVDARPVVVREGSWIGARAIILPGVVISPGCVIASGAVVISDCDADGLYAGVPARRVRDLPT